MDDRLVLFRVVALALVLGLFFFLFFFGAAVGFLRRGGAVFVGLGLAHVVFVFVFVSVVIVVVIVRFPLAGRSARLMTLATFALGKALSVLVAPRA